LRECVAKVLFRKFDPTRATGVAMEAQFTSQPER
jgi:hypothetical protein